MSEGVEVKLKELQKTVESHLQGMHELSQILKNQAMRILQMKSIFTSKGDHKVSGKIAGNGTLAEYDDYKELISKDLCQKIDELTKSFRELRRSMAILSTDLKTKKAENADIKLAAFNAKVEHILEQFGGLWGEGSYLMCNYRLDIAAQEVGRWSRGLQGVVQEEEIRTEVANLFK